MGKEWLSTEIAEITEDRWRNDGGSDPNDNEEGRESSLIRVIRGQLRDATPELTQGRKDARQNKSADESGFLTGCTGLTGLPAGLRKLSCSSCSSCPSFLGGKNRYHLLRGGVSLRKNEVNRVDEAP